MFCGGVAASYHATRQQVEDGSPEGIYAGYVHEGFLYGEARTKHATTRGLPIVACLLGALNDDERAQVLAAFVRGAIDGFTTNMDECEA